MTSIRTRHSWYLPFKFALDWLAGVALLFPAGLLIGFLAVMVKATSPGSAFYSQHRLGRGGRVFIIFKLRTMIQDSEASTGPVWSQPGDRRVTWIGRILRDTHLDELPQIWNILRGEMSWIGPRPERPEIAARLELHLPHYHDRTAIRPGLTGLAQVELPPDSNDDGVRRKLAYDRYYVEKVSPGLDLRIALSTCLYLFSTALKTLCHTLVRSYGRDAECTLAGEEVEANSEPVRMA